MVYRSNGVPYLGCTLASCAGRSASAAIVYRIRDCPKRTTRITGLRPAMAPIFIRGLNHRRPGPAAPTPFALGKASRYFIPS